MEGYQGDKRREDVLLDTVLELAAAHHLLKAGGWLRMETTHVLAAVLAMNRTESVNETLRHALEVLALTASDWLRSHALPHWAARMNDVHSTIARHGLPPSEMRGFA